MTTTLPRESVEYPASMTGVSMAYKRILYLQFTNPANYPPLEHSSRILAGQGWDVLFLGTAALRASDLQFRSCSQIQVKKMPLATGARQKIQYACFFVWALYWTFRWRPRWIYASDPLACPIVWLMQKLFGVRVLYHEHDSPSLAQPQSAFMRAVVACRNKLAREAALCVLPQADRLRHFTETTNRAGPTVCVWNCPSRKEAQHGAVAPKDMPLILYYHGSIGRSRLPPTVLIAAMRFRRAVRLRIAGYETVGSIGYVRELMSLAEKQGLSDIIDVLGTITLRRDMLRSALQSHVGLSLMPKEADDSNLRYMVGASNKPFDYMACGLPLLVSNLPDWTSTFVAPGWALNCDPDDDGSIQDALQWFLDHPAERREMGRKGQAKIKSEWNYETMFSDVLMKLENA
jgi:glycosyltransferase involved in cell wall biosynthesis